MDTRLPHINLLHYSGFFDFITEHSSEQAINNLCFTPIVNLARQFISYYYPFSFHNFYRGCLAADKFLKVLNYNDDFKAKIRLGGNIIDKIHQNFRTLKEEGVFWINRRYELPDYLKAFPWKVRQRILLQPLNFLHKVNGGIY